MDAAIAQAELEPTQRNLLAATATMYRPRTAANPFGDPLATFHWISEAEGKRLDAQGEELAVFCHFYLLGLDLLDDVQDDDLAGKPHQDAGSAIAINNGLMLLFLGMSSLERVMRAEKTTERAVAYVSLVNRVALLTGRGQHRDLMGLEGSTSGERILDMHKQKTASVTLICECAALYAGCEPATRERYRAIGEHLALLVQVLDDLRDIFGKRQSPDLAQSRPSYPLACFLEVAGPADIEQLASLRAALPETIREVRRLLYDSGAVQGVARALERFRQAIHAEVAMLGGKAGPYRILLQSVDSLVSAVYSPKPVPATRSLFEPQTPWHQRVRALGAEFGVRMSGYEAPPTPRFVPWHLPQWMFDKRTTQVFYPDYEGMPEETLTFQAALLGEGDLAVVGALVERQAPAVLAHELFHHFRETSVGLGKDKWYEELAANALAVAYCRQYEPAALLGGLEIARRVLARPEHALSPAAVELVDELCERTTESDLSRDYGFDMHQMALIQLALIERLAGRVEGLDDAVARYLVRPRS